MPDTAEDFVDAKVGAVVLAAGQSRRMGQNKLVLPWGRKTVIEQVVQTLAKAGVNQIVVVTGSARGQVEIALSREKVRTVYNPDYAGSEMLTSLQVGIRASGPDLEAVLVVLGDQPGIQPGVVSGLVDLFQQTQGRIIIPSYQMRRGHPWLIRRDFWEDILVLPAENTPRDFIQMHQNEITYLIVDTPTVLKDIDTPEDYRQHRPDSPD